MDLGVQYNIAVFLKKGKPCSPMGLTAATLGTQATLAYITINIKHHTKMVRGITKKISMVAKLPCSFMIVPTTTKDAPTAAKQEDFFSF